MHVLKTTVDDEIKVAFGEMAAKAALPESKLLRLLILKSLTAEPVVPAVVAPVGVETNTGQITVRMPKFLLKEVRNRAKEKGGIAASRWIWGLIQSNLLQEPIMTSSEIDALKESSRELAALGRNLNQIARALNDNFNETDRVKLKFVELLSDSVSENRKLIRKLVKASQNSWGAEDWH